MWSRDVCACTTRTKAGRPRPVFRSGGLVGRGRRQPHLPDAGGPVHGRSGTDRGAPDRQRQQGTPVRGECPSSSGCSESCPSARSSRCRASDGDDARDGGRSLQRLQTAIPEPRAQSAAASDCGVSRDFTGISQPNPPSARDPYPDHRSSTASSPSKLDATGAFPAPGKLTPAGSSASTANEATAGARRRRRRR